MAEDLEVDRATKVEAHSSETVLGRIFGLCAGFALPFFFVSDLFALSLLSFEAEEEDEEKLDELDIF